jgi:flagellar biogenesis protein FliO
MDNINCEASLGEPKSPWAILSLRIRALFSKVNIQRRPRRLRLCETLSLGDKRMLALVECENRRFLLAATSQSVSLIQSLGIAQEEDQKSGL